MSSSTPEQGSVPTGPYPGAPACAGPDPHTRTPAFRMPPGACDTHAHVFGPVARFPYADARSYTPPEATVERYAALLDTLGIERCVLVQGGPHGTDNRVTLDAIARLGARARGVAVIRPDLDDAQRQALHDGGMRGCRMSTVVRGGAGFEHLEALSAQTRPLGWHLVLHLRRSEELVDLAPRLRALDQPFVLDHLGHVLGDEGVEAPGFQALLGLLDTDRCWVKLASLYRSSSRPHPYEDMLPMIHRVVAARPDRLLWGSNWPHPINPVAMPNDGDLVDLIPVWVPDAAARQQMLVDNPARLYGF